MEDLVAIPCTLMRGGTSKAVFIETRYLPAEPECREAIICALFGSPDRRQIDGLGGADPLTSKVALIGPAGRPDADVDYTFGQVAITERQVDWRGNCGNITAAVGPYAIEHGYVTPVSPMTEVRIHNTNTGKVLREYVPVVDGRVKYRGDYRIDGVPGTAARIDIDFSSTRGAVTGRLLPTGNQRDELEVPGVGQVQCSIVDIANPVVFLRAADLGLTGREQPAEVDGDPALLEKLELIRGAAAARIGLCRDATTARTETPSVPLLAFMSTPADAEPVTINSRLMFMQVMHKTYSGTATICTGVAVNLEGTIPAELARRDRPGHSVIIGHPAGSIDVKVKVRQQGDDWEIEEALLGRTARKLMEGTAYYLVP